MEIGYPKKRISSDFPIYNPDTKNILIILNNNSDSHYYNDIYQKLLLIKELGYNISVLPHPSTRKIILGSLVEEFETIRHGNEYSYFVSIDTTMGLEFIIREYPTVLVQNQTLFYEKLKLNYCSVEELFEVFHDKYKMKSSHCNNVEIIKNNWQFAFETSIDKAFSYIQEVVI